jgi:hypothetical protein
MTIATILALETATDACSVALLHAGGVATRHAVAPRRHTEIVLDMLDAVLAEAGCDRAGIRRGLQCEDGRDGHCGRLRGVRGERL